MDKSNTSLAILYADVSGSTRLYEQFGDAIARADVGKCLELLGEVAGNHDGRVVKSIGDEIMCTFPNALKAALSAIEMQEELLVASEGGQFQSGRLHIKIGWHFGSIQTRGKEIIGEAPVIAQQIIKLAKANEILTSGHALNLLPDELTQRVHRIERLDSIVDGVPAQVDVFLMQWEESEEVTQFGQESPQTSPDVQHSLLLAHEGLELHLNDSKPQCVIGRSADSDLCVNGKYASRHHARIQMRHGNFHIQDQSANGTVIEFDDGRQSQLRREECLLSGSGRIGIGEAPGDSGAATVSFRCK